MDHEGNWLAPIYLLRQRRGRWLVLYLRCPCTGRTFTVEGNQAIYCASLPAFLLFSRLSWLAATEPILSCFVFSLLVQVSNVFHITSTTLLGFLAHIHLSFTLRHPVPRLPSVDSGFNVRTCSSCSTGYQRVIALFTRSTRCTGQRVSAFLLMKFLTTIVQSAPFILVNLFYWHSSPQKRAKDTNLLLAKASDQKRQI